MLPRCEETVLKDDMLLLRCGRGGRQNSGLSYVGVRKDSGDTAEEPSAVMLPDRVGSADKSSIEEGRLVGTDSLFDIGILQRSEALGERNGRLSGTDNRCGDGVFRLPILDSRFLSYAFEESSKLRCPNCLSLCRLLNVSASVM